MRARLPILTGSGRFFDRTPLAGALTAGLAGEVDRITCEGSEGHLGWRSWDEVGRFMERDGRAAEVVQDILGPVRWDEVQTNYQDRCEFNT